MTFVLCDLSKILAFAVDQISFQVSGDGGSLFCATSNRVRVVVLQTN
jgi:hypothetical protein